MKKYSKIICLIIIMASMLIMLTGCGEIDKAEEVINNAFTVLKSLDFEAAYDYINIDELMKSESEKNSRLFLMENTFNKLECEIISSEKIDKNTVVVKTKITAVDMIAVLNEYNTKFLPYILFSALSSSQGEYETIVQMLIECISKEDIEMVTREVDIEVVRIDRKWKIKSTEEFSNAVFGGLEQALKNNETSQGVWSFMSYLFNVANQNSTKQ